MTLEIEKYYPDMEIIDSNIESKILNIVEKVDFNKYKDEDVLRALKKETLEIEDFCALLSDSAKNHLEEIAKRAKYERERYFGKNVYFFTPLDI